jgi:hypothetical protein
MNFLRQKDEMEGTCAHPSIFLTIFLKGQKKMNKTRLRKTDQIIAVDIEKLAGMLSCGRATARKIGEQAGARIEIGRRVLYSVDAVIKYLETLQE